MYRVLNHTYRVSLSVQNHRREMQVVLMPTEWQVNGGLLQLPCLQGVAWLTLGSFVLSCLAVTLRGFLAK